MLDELEATFEQYRQDPDFIKELRFYLEDYSVPDPLSIMQKVCPSTWAEPRFTSKREDLNHLGSHKLNNVLGQILLAKRMGKTVSFAETGAGQHGVATAAAGAKFGMECDVYMGAEDVKRQRLNVFRMEMMGAKVHAVTEGTATLKEAVDGMTFGAWMNDLDAFYVLGSAVGPHPYPTIVHEFQRLSAKSPANRILDKDGNLPDAVIACVGGGSKHRCLLSIYRRR